MLASPLVLLPVDLAAGVALIEDVSGHSPTAISNAAAHPPNQGHDRNNQQSKRDDHE